MRIQTDNTDFNELKEEVNSSPFFRHMGMELTQLSEGYALISFPFQDRLRNSFGTLHGGVIGSLADSAGGVAIRTLVGSQKITTVEFKVNFLSPVQGGELYAEGRVVRKGSSIAVAEVEVRDEAGRSIAVALATYMVLEDRVP